MNNARVFQQNRTTAQRESDLFIASMITVIDNEEIECTSSLNLLGVLIDNKLNFSEHIQQVCQKANCKTGVLSRMKNLVPERTKLHLFKAVNSP